MTRQEAVDAIAGHFRTGWNARTLIAWDNVPAAVDEGVEWVRFSIQHNIEGQETVADKMFVRRGIVFLQLFVPINTGRDDVDTLTEDALAIFEDSEPFGITFSNATGREIGNVEGRWHQTNIIVEFQYTEIR